MIRFAAEHLRILTCVAFGALAAASVATPLATPASASAAAAPATQRIAMERPAALWSGEAVAELRAELAAAAGEGLDPVAYGAARLNDLVEGPEADAVATSIALQLAEDYAHGRVNERTRFGWYIEAGRNDPERMKRDMVSALKSGQVRPWLRSLLPSDARYVALRAAYATTADEAERTKLRVNLERWRWMPRELGPDYIYVNVPSYTLKVVEEGQPVSNYTVVVGKPSTPTPQIAVAAQSVVVNPWWNVPISIARTMKSSAGYARDGNTIRQPPGPRNALGRIKIDMPNPHSIYLHDTPSKSLFAKESRAFSHGCIRVQDVERLARELVELDGERPQQVDSALAGSATRTVRLTRARPVYLVYFTMDVDAAGRVVHLEDPYGRDSKLAAGLAGSTRLAAANAGRSIG